MDYSRGSGLVLGLTEIVVTHVMLLSWISKIWGFLSLSYFSLWRTLTSYNSWNSKWLLWFNTFIKHSSFFQCFHCSNITIIDDGQLERLFVFVNVLSFVFDCDLALSGWNSSHSDTRDYHLTFCWIHVDGWHILDLRWWNRHRLWRLNYGSWCRCSKLLRLVDRSFNLAHVFFSFFLGLWRHHSSCSCISCLSVTWLTLTNFSGWCSGFLSISWWSLLCILVLLSSWSILSSVSDFFNFTLSGLIIVQSTKDFIIGSNSG